MAWLKYVFVIVSVVMVQGLVGCASGEQTTRVTLAASDYPAMFDAAREAVRDAGYQLDRVDAQAGVITSLPRSTAGLATPWSSPHTGGSQEVEDLVNRHSRSVQITFYVADGAGLEMEGGAFPSEPVPSIVDADGELVMDVAVVVWRNHRPGWRVNPHSVRHSTYARHTELARRGLQPRYAVPFTRDGASAGRLAKRIIAQTD